ncbi:hypothetical protein AFLA_008158 [Aspergillus flavus NRRL3357]|nr:hypothetical protein AFLA_008158 [Aspergillus flavus NRRL3357]
MDEDTPIEFRPQAITTDGLRPKRLCFGHVRLGSGSSPSQNIAPNIFVKEDLNLRRPRARVPRSIESVPFQRVYRILGIHSGSNYMPTDHSGRQPSCQIHNGGVGELCWLQ